MRFDLRGPSPTIYYRKLLDLSVMIRDACVSRDGTYLRGFLRHPSFELVCNDVASTVLARLCCVWKLEQI